jgi:hypothetical protein
MRRLPLLLVAALLASCTAGTAPTPAPTAAPTASPDATACGPRSTAGYPGWPSPGQVAATAELIPIIASSEIAVGPARLLFAITDGQNQPLAADDVTTDVRLFALARDPANPATSVEGAFMDLGLDRGLYRASAEFDCSGEWGAEVTAHLPDGDRVARVVFDVQPTSTTPAIGAPAPRSETPTADTPQGIAAISTDPDPDPDFYRQSIAQAVTSGKPSMLVFATPAFCQTRTCGPALDVIKDVAADFKDEVVFVNVEPYLLQETPNGLQPLLDDKGRLQPVEAVLDYGLVTEPYTFVVDADGNVAAKFEGMAGADELRSALESVTQPA